MIWGTFVALNFHITFISHHDDVVICYYGKTPTNNNKEKSSTLRNAEFNQWQTNYNKSIASILPHVINQLWLHDDFD